MNNIVRVTLTNPKNKDFFGTDIVEMPITNYIYGLACSIANSKKYINLLLASIWATNQVHYWDYHNQPLTDYNNCYAFNYNVFDNVDEFAMTYIEAHCHTVLVDKDYTILKLTKPMYDEYLANVQELGDDYELIANLCQYYHCIETVYDYK